MQQEKCIVLLDILKLNNYKYMPLGKNVGKNIAELYRDNKKKGKAKGNNGKARSRKQIIAIAYAAAKKK
jgi:hypothetical protein